MKSCLSDSAGIAQDEQQFADSVNAELQQLTSNTIAGLGISQQEFENWKTHNN